MRIKRLWWDRMMYSRRLTPVARNPVFFSKCGWWRISLMLPAQWNRIVKGASWGIWQKTGRHQLIHLLFNYCVLMNQECPIISFRSFVMLSPGAWEAFALWPCFVLPMMRKLLSSLQQPQSALFSFSAIWTLCGLDIASESYLFENFRGTVSLQPASGSKLFCNWFMGQPLLPTMLLWTCTQGQIKEQHMPQKHSSKQRRSVTS